MPRQYLTPAEFSATPIGQGYTTTGTLAQLGVGVLDTLSFRASQRADQLANKRLGMPGGTTTAGPVAQGATVLPVASTLGFDARAEQGVYVGAGTQKELLSLVPGGVLVSSTVTPYPGVLTLATPTTFSHSAGEVVMGVYREVREAGSASSSDVYSEALQSQAAQLAMAHMAGANGGLTRIVFTKEYPIAFIYAVEHAYSFDNAWLSMDTSGLSIEPTLGWYRFNIGSVVTPQGLTRTTYSAGYQSIPDDVKEAVSLLMADQVSLLLNPQQATSYHLGKRSYTFGLLRGRSGLEQRAADLLAPYTRFV